MTLGTRLSKAEIRQHKEWLAVWRSPKSMLEYLSGVMGSLGKGVHGSRILFTQGGLRFLHEAHTAATFASARRASYVRFVVEDPPDFEMQFGNATEQFECTEADVGGRKRGDEYRDTAKVCNDEDGLVVELEPVDELYKASTTIRNALRIVSKKKAMKRYSNNYKLLICLNFYDVGEKRASIERSFGRCTKVAKEAFSDIWILWDGRPYHVWSHGEPPDCSKRDEESATP